MAPSLSLLLLPRPKLPKIPSPHHEGILSLNPMLKLFDRDIPVASIWLMLPTVGSGRMVPLVPGNGALMLRLRRRCAPLAVSHEKVVPSPCRHDLSKDREVFTT